MKYRFSCVSVAFSRRLKGMVAFRNVNEKLNHFHTIFIVDMISTLCLRELMIVICLVSQRVLRARQLWHRENRKYFYENISNFHGLRVKHILETKFKKKIRIQLFFFVNRAHIFYAYLSRLYLLSVNRWTKRFWTMYASLK